MHLAASDTCQKENLLMGREQLHSRCRILKHCSLLASDWPAHDRGDRETALCLSLINRQDAEVNKLMFLTRLPVTHPYNASYTFHYLLFMLTSIKASVCVLNNNKLSLLSDPQDLSTCYNVASLMQHDSIWHLAVLDCSSTRGGCCF